MSDLFPAEERAAVLSDCGRYRYLLRREWDAKAPRALYVMLNPSTADAEQDDATIRSCRRLCKSFGHGSFEVVNLYGWRSTDPKGLLTAADPVGPNNDLIMRAAALRCDLVLFAWGAFPGVQPSRVRAVYDIMRDAERFPYCLGRTKGGAPKHPLYIKTGTMLEMFTP